MSRAKTGTVAWRGTPARWWARLTVRKEDGGTRRVWVDLERHAAKSVTERHYMGRGMETMARAVATLTLALPERPGVLPPGFGSFASIVL